MQIERFAKEFADVSVLIPTLGDPRVMDGLRLLRRGDWTVSIPHWLPHQDGLQLRRREFLEDLPDDSMTRLASGTRRREKGDDSNLVAGGVEFLAHRIGVY